MINIFNLFLTLFSFWLAFSYSNNNLSWFYVFCGMISALIVSLIAWRIKIITKYSHFLFLHVGFYKHFIGIIAYYFLESLKIAFNAARNKQDNYKIYSLPIKKLNNTELVLLISTINLLPGTIFIGIEGEKINIFALDKKYIEKLNLDKICDSLEKINDNRLV